jgi:hypothetical protein
MIPRTILQIIPRRTSNPDGIGDYAVRLAAGLKERHAISSIFVSGTPGNAHPPAEDEWPTVAVASRSRNALFEAISLARRQAPFSAVILHVAGYGYQKRGAPLWLLQGMRNWRRRHPEVQLVNLLHELYATGKPWNSSFWLQPLQKYVARELWKLSDSGLTTNAREYPELLAWRPAAANHLVLMPVVSNVGEPVETPSIHARPARAAIFGAPGTERIYTIHRELLEGAVRELGIREIVDIGARLVPPPSDIGGASVTCQGVQPADVVSRELADCRYGFLSYDLSLVGKSGVFAAYAAHGIIPICFGSASQPGLNLVPGQHFLTPPLHALDTMVLVSMQHAIKTWYRGHDTARLTDSVVHLCTNRSPLPQQSNHFRVSPACNSIDLP